MSTITIFSTIGDSVSREREDIRHQLGRSSTFLEQVEAAQSLLVDVAQALNSLISGHEPDAQLHLVVVVRRDDESTELVSGIVESGLGALVRSLSREFPAERLRVNGVLSGAAAPDSAPLIELLLQDRGAPFIGQVIHLD